MRHWFAGFLMLIALTTPGRGDDTPAKTACSHPGLERLKSLAGTWVEAGKDGKPTDTVISEIRVTAAGSAVHETLSPGQPDEMVSVYHLDKGDLVMTHYCTFGNQPRLKADADSSPNQLHFKFVGGSNVDPAKDMHIHETTLTFIDANHIEMAAVAWAGGKPSKAHCAKLALVRKK
jgi:hypothetical protein